jgi:hypothetical protein
MAKKKSSKASDAPTPYDDSKWRAQSDMEALCRAEEIRADRARLSAAKKAAAGKMKELSAIGGRGRSTSKRTNPQAAREKRLEGKYL